MIWVICYIVMHSAYGKLDNRTYKPSRGYVMRESGDNLLVNFSKDFKHNKIDTGLNPVVQLINGNECTYEY